MPSTNSPYNFDKDAKEYAAGLGYESPDYYVREKAKVLKRLCKRYRITGRALDVGCGLGWGVREMAPQFERIIGIDPAEGMIRQARNSGLPSNTRFETADGLNLPFSDETFDLAYSFCVLHHLSSEEDAERMIREQIRAVKKGGLVAQFDHNPLNPVVVKRVKNCPIDEGAVLRRRLRIERLMRTAGLTVIESRYIIFFPEALRSFSFMDPLLGWCPMGGQYYVLGRKG